MMWNHLLGVVISFLKLIVFIYSGSAPPETELEPDEEAEASEKAVLDKAAEKSEIQINEEQNPNSVLPMTPLQLCR